MIKIYAILRSLFRQPVACLLAIPRNFVRSIACIDLAFVPHFIPGAEDVRSEYIEFDVLFLPKLAKKAWTVSPSAIEILKMIVVLVTFFPLSVLALTYRWALKSTAILWLPLVWIVIQAQPSKEVTPHLDFLRRSAWSRMMRTYSLIVLVGFCAKLAILFGVWKLRRSGWLGPLGIATTELARLLISLSGGCRRAKRSVGMGRLLSCGSTPPGAGTAEAATEPGCGEEFAAFQVARTTLSLYVIACTFYITASVAWQTDWPPIRVIPFPWMA